VIISPEQGIFHICTTELKFHQATLHYTLKKIGAVERQKFQRQRPFLANVQQTGDVEYYRYAKIDHWEVGLRF